MSDKENVTMEVKETNVKETNTDNEEEVLISKKDLAVLLNLLHISAQRGTFRLNEYKDIGVFFEKINELLSK
jgi:hypothetical protein